jgi:hypothetical protein
METQTGNVISRAYFLFPEDQKMWAGIAQSV